MHKLDVSPIRPRLVVVKPESESGGVHLSTFRTALISAISSSVRARAPTAPQHQAPLREPGTHQGERAGRSWALLRGNKHSGWMGMPYYYSLPPCQSISNTR